MNSQIYTNPVLNVRYKNLIDNYPYLGSDIGFDRQSMMTAISYYSNMRIVEFCFNTYYKMPSRPGHKEQLRKYFDMNPKEQSDILTAIKFVRDIRRFERACELYKVEWEK